MRHYMTARFDVDQVIEEEGLGVFEGYAAVFDELVPSYNEVVRKGAFKKTTQEHGGRVPILYMHDPFELPVGHGLFAEEDNIGYRVKGGLLINSYDKAAATHAYLKLATKAKTPAGLSIGFTPMKYKESKDKDGNRMPTEITELRLFEYSITPPQFQAAPNAKATEVRSRAAERDEIFDYLLEFTQLADLDTPALAKMRKQRQAALEAVKPSEEDTPPAIITPSQYDELLAETRRIIKLMEDTPHGR